MFGKNKATILKSHATPEPIPMSVNIFKFHVTTERHALSKNIHVA